MDIILLGMGKGNALWVFKSGLLIHSNDSRNPGKVALVLLKLEYNYNNKFIIIHKHQIVYGFSISYFLCLPEVSVSGCGH